MAGKIWFEKGKTCILGKNNELAGEAAILHAFQCYGQLPFGLSTAIIGNGNTAHGAVRVLNMLGAKVMQYNVIQRNYYVMKLDNMMLLLIVSYGIQNVKIILFTEKTFLG